MKRFIMICAVAAVFILTSSAMAVYVVDLGSSEPYPMSDWGQVWPGTPPGPVGGWGGIATDPLSPDNLCRTVWGVGDSRIATITFPTPIDSVEIRHLDGLALDLSGGGGDDFEVYVDYVYWGSYVSDPATGEYWLTSMFSGTPGTTLMIMSTDPQWASFGTWGQLGIDWINAVPEPATICLLGLGGLALLKRRT